MWGILLDSQPRKFLKKLSKDLAKRITGKLRVAFEHGPVPHDTKALVGEHGVFRLRVGDYRILYRVDYDEMLIVIIKIDKRERVY